MLYLQGLLAPHAMEVIPIRILMERAAFLQDERAYLDFAGQSKGTGNYVASDIAMISGVPEIQAAILATDNPISMEIGDPEIVNWTHGLVRYYSDNPPRFPNQIIDWTRGYIHAPQVGSSWFLREYLTGYLTREMQSYPDPFVDSPKLNEVVRRAISLVRHDADDELNIYMDSGYFPAQLFEERLDRLIEAALMHVQPKFIRRYLSEARVTLGSADIYIKIEHQIRYSMVERAEEMLGLLGQIDSEYITSLRILTGRRIDPDLLPGLVERWSTIPDEYRITHIPALQLMVAVAHPQIPKDVPPKIFESASYGVRSPIFYDLVHYSSIAGYLTLNRFVLERLIRLYAIGRLLDGFPPEKINLLMGLLDRINGRAQSKLEQGFMERYQLILQNLLN